MPEIAVQIVRYVSDDPQPGIVTSEFVDADGQGHTIVDKVPLFTIDPLDANSVYPHPGVVACEVLARWQDARGRSLVRITTMKPWHVESTDGVSEFIVLEAQIKETASLGQE